MSDIFSAKLLSLFPDVGMRASDDDKKLPYVLMTYLVEYLEVQAKNGALTTAEKKLLEFNSWCRTQSRKERGADDIFTILVVGLYESILQKDDLYHLIVDLVPRNEFLDAKEYLLKWVNEAQYSRALLLYPAK